MLDILKLENFLRCKEPIEVGKLIIQVIENFLTYVRTFQLHTCQLRCALSNMNVSNSPILQLHFSTSNQPFLSRVFFKLVSEFQMRSQLRAPPSPHYSKTTNLKTILKVINIWLIHFFSLNQRKLFRWMDLGKHYPLIGMMIL